MPIGDITKCQSPKNFKNWGFSPPQDDRINWSRRNFADKRTPWVCYSTPNLALIGKRGSVQEPPKCPNLPKIVVFGYRKPTQWTHSDEIWPVSLDLGSALAHQIWPSSAKGGRYRSPINVKICPKLFFGHRNPTQWTHSDKIWRIRVLLPLLPSSASFPASNI